jgi:glycosyltransferase involved in cell wall biosynthesis
MQAMLKKSDSKVRTAILDHVGQKAGMDYFTLRLHRGLQAQGIHNTVYSNFVSPEDKGIQPVFAFSAKNQNAFSKALAYSLGIWRAFAGIRKEGSGHLLFHFFKAGPREMLVLLLARFHGQCIHLLVHDVESLDTQHGPGGSRSPALNRLIWRWIMEYGSDRLYTFSHSAAGELRRHLNPKLHDRLTVLHHGHFLDLPLPEPDRATARQRLGLNPETYVLLFFGQIKASKGPDLLLEAFGNITHTDLRLIIAGQSRDYPIKEMLNQQPYSVKSRITHLDRFITDEERDMLFKACDLVVLPYRRIYNSGVLMMALSYARTVLASDLEANREILLSNFPECLFESGNSAALTHAIIAFYKRNSEVKPTQYSLDYLEHHFSWFENSRNIAKNLSKY